MLLFANSLICKLANEVSFKRGFVCQLENQRIRETIHFSNEQQRTMKNLMIGLMGAAVLAGCGTCNCSVESNATFARNALQK